MLSITLFTACTPDNDFSLGTPQNRVEQLTGTWKLQSATQTDLLAKNYNFVDPSRPNVSLITQDITSYAAFTDVAVTFNADGTNPGTFAINYGNAPQIFRLTAGNWQLDNKDAPGKLNMINGNDTTKLELYNLNLLSANKFGLRLVRYEGVKPVTQYDYAFQKN